MAKKKLRIATCQFPIGSSINRNAEYILSLMKQAKKKRAELVHFSECALSGYAGVDLTSIDELDWALLTERTEEIMASARQLKLWVVLGSTHRLTEPNKPHNSLYLIDPAGKIKDRYDKRFCTEGDMAHYTPGQRSVLFTINGIKCSLLICFDLRFPELYRELRKQGVECVLQSFYNARLKHRTVHTDIMRQTMQCRAATNYFWISMNNSCASRSAYPSCLIQPDGKIVDQLHFHRPGLMVNTVDTSKDYYDASGLYRAAAMKGKLSNGRPIRDARSRSRTIL